MRFALWAEVSGGADRHLERGCFAASVVLVWPSHGEAKGCGGVICEELDEFGAEMFQNIQVFRVFCPPQFPIIWN